MSNTIKPSNWANRTKEAVANIPTPAVPAGMSVRGGGGEKILAFYRFTTPKVGNGSSRVLTAGTAIEGTYEGAFESTNYPGNFTYKVRTAEGLMGLPHCKQLTDDLGGVKVGTRVYVLYKGQETVKQGKYAGKPRHAFLVASEPSGDDVA